MHHESTFHFLGCSSNMLPGEWVAVGVLTGMTNSLLSSMAASAYQPAPRPEHRFHFTRAPTPRLPLDVYTDPFIEDSLGLLYVCVCVCEHNSLGPQHSLSAWSLDAWQCRVCSSRPGERCVPGDERWKSGQGQVLIQASATLMRPKTLRAVGWI